MFMSAVFYPISALPPSLQPWLKLNPLALIVEQTRRVLVEGAYPSAPYIFAGTAMAVIFCELAYRGFVKAQKGFADVI